ncbi:hypothetical protein PR202_ga07187 [Eleusine coracana subsp. coracana]|uniref:adrenodoxin-NADP(+) reductase n=1 Tax=Eleusine coracana subsp. coracana TaxID=191504 RepID=A0AAV5BXW6_ELECO|nr:hypothetical protein PR202_ga07187 [Eleusine coracana subsp. coracana]
MARGLQLLSRAARRLLLSPGPRRGFSSAREPLHVCVVGSGPAGFYTADRMLKGHEGAQVDIIDRLPTPFGLVRSGVAPDHPETKIVVNQFSRVAANGRCSFIGNVTLGRDISLSELRDTYHVVVLAYGAESDRSLGIPGEDLKGVYSAREFVWWYNGHPDMCNLAPDLASTDSAVVLGQGNVALDVARILLRCLKNVHVSIKEADLVTSPADEKEMRTSRIQRRVYELLSKAANAHKDCNNNEQKELRFVFFRRPARFLPSENGSTVGAVQLEKTFLKDNGVTGNQMAVGTGEFEDLKCGLVFKSIGYKSLTVQDLPFDENRGIVPNVRGRVLRSNMVASILDDDKNGVFTPPFDLKKQGRMGLLEILERKNVHFVPFSGWEKIDSKEKRAGQLTNKPREKITTWDGLLKAANEE